jgi:hypothetical protein
MGSVWLVDDRSPIGSDASGSVDPVDAGDSMGSVWLVDYRSPIGPDASRAVDPGRKRRRGPVGPERARQGPTRQQ